MNNTLEQYNCPEFSAWDKDVVTKLRYWVGGVVLCGVAISGLLMNITAIYILSTRIQIKNFFNSLLISLFVYDSVYLFIDVVDTFKTNFRIYTKIHIILFPYIIHPLKPVSLTASIFMTIGIAYERFVAIRSPIIHRQSMESSRFRRKHLLKYILSVTICSFINLH